MAERSKAHAWKVCMRDERIEGSNPSLSASKKKTPCAQQNAQGVNATERGAHDGGGFAPSIAGSAAGCLAMHLRMVDVCEGRFGHNVRVARKGYGGPPRIAAW